MFKPPLIEDEAVRDYYEDIADALRLGRDYEQFVKRLRRRNPEDETEISQAEHYIRGQLAGMDDTIIIVPPRTPSWYVGPLPDFDVYWPQLEKKIRVSLGPATDIVDSSSSEVVRSLRPAGGDSFQLKGLVVGNVQSGKTTNFMSVIAKAADAGYRLIVVLTGMTENLRVQTQARIEEQLIDEKVGHWTRLTTIEHDFIGNDNPQHLKDPNWRFLAVVKKNPSRLRKLNQWINSGGELANSCPILVIDDEADQASIDVSPKGKVQRSAINRQIADLLKHDRTAYIGYTATPFANVLIDPNKTDDLYPKDFIHVLPEPDGYFGAEALFGREPLFGENADDVESTGHDMIRVVPEAEVERIKPPSPKNPNAADFHPEIGEKLEEAITWFILATAARWARGQENKHSSMLIHTSMLTAAHYELKFLVSTLISELKSQVTSIDKIPKAWEELWVRETTAVPASDFGLTPLSFEEIQGYVVEVISKLRIIVDNALSNDRLNYDSKSGTETVIAIGGNTLARGLTLEGLVSSYFVRGASAYDTLMQMGRWFGFRHGYQDLPRIWTTEQLEVWFRDLALVEADLRQELAVYAAEKRTPLEVQAQIRTLPNMQVTSRAKMKDAKHSTMTFSGQKLQTIKFKSKDKEWLEKNITATRKFVAEMIEASATPLPGPNGTIVFKNVSNEIVFSFLRNYQFHENTRLGGPQFELLMAYLQKEEASKNLRSWNVSLFGQSSEKQGSFSFGSGLSVNKVRRSRMDDEFKFDANIKTLVGSLDRLNDLFDDDLDHSELLADLTEKIERNKNKRDVLIRQAHDNHAGTAVGHLAIYVIDKDSKARPTSNPKPKLKTSGQSRVDLEAVEDIIGLGIFLPTSSNPSSGVEYVSAIEPNQELLDAQFAFDEEYAVALDDDIQVTEEVETEAIEKEADVRS